MLTVVILCRLYLGVVRLRVEVSGAHGGVEDLDAVRVAPVEPGVQLAHLRGDVHHSGSFMVPKFDKSDTVVGIKVGIVKSVTAVSL